MTLIWTNLDNCILFCILSLTMGCWQYKDVDCKCRLMVTYAGRITIHSDDRSMEADD